MAKATKQELETAKAKAVKGGMPQEVADKVIQMAGSKGTFAMQMNKPKNNSADNFSSKDSQLMMQSALYLDPKDPPTKDDSNKLEGYTGSENIDKSKTVNTPSSEQIQNFQNIKEDVIKNKKTFMEGLQNLKTSDSLNTILKEGEGVAANRFNFDLYTREDAGPNPGSVHLGSNVRGSGGEDVSGRHVNNVYPPSAPGSRDSSNTRRFREVYNEAKKYQDLISERKEYNKNNAPSLNMAPLKFYGKK